MPLPSFILSFSTHKVTAQDLAAGAVNPVILIDVRSPEEYASDRIHGSYSIPLETIQTGGGVEAIQAIVRQASGTTTDVTPTVVLYCSVCPGAIRAYQKLQAVGLNIAVLFGGLTAWRQRFSAAQDATILTPVLPDRPVTSPLYNWPQAV